ncbi:YhjD/YihY/BrkB family envelope integrity protein [Streptomyces sp. HD]|uniref:YhjD/YihY/BrkB family envelope integrity protein n=1 Tax=Streptomyces sp. HD TaxID=3020892 RepID=UPI00232D112C|nr:YhjD/YihY/BrkB family envelope integrity protein [Streptomyces sp. HD]MDC0771722.1 YhjD/YihY/BrkB family envelope integrity protein [Streptomyces sp. HD]
MPRLRRRQLMRREGTGKDSGTPPGRAGGVECEPGPRRRTRSLLRASWWRGRIGELTAWLEAVHARVETRFPVVTALVDRMVSVNIFDSATRIAAQCFLTAVPLLFVLSAYAPSAVQDQVSASIRAVFGLTGPAMAQVEQAFQPPSDDLRQATGLVGVLMVLLSATAVSRAVQRLCRRAWLLPRAGAKVAPWRWLAWIGLWLGALVVQGMLRNGFGLGAVLGFPVVLVMQTAMWWWTQHLLLGGAVRWAPLLPGAVITAIAVSVLSVTAHLYMPRALNRALADYGSAGSVFVLLSWLIVVCVAVAVGLSAGAVLSQEPFLRRRLGTPTSPPGETDHA